MAVLFSQVNELLSGNGTAESALAWGKERSKSVTIFRNGGGFTSRSSHPSRRNCGDYS